MLPENTIIGGATIWARQTIDSEIFFKKPDKWFKIWFYIVNRVNHTERRGFKRGECYIGTGEIEEATGASKDQAKKCLKWLRDSNMIDTERSTRGMRIIVIKYNVYQDFDSYRSTREAPEKHQRSTTINNNGNNESNISADAEPINKDMSFKNQRRYNENGHWEEPAVDAESGEATVDPLEEERSKDRELNEIIRHNLKLVEPSRGLPFGTGQDMNYHVKIYRSMLKSGWSHETLVTALLELINSDYWIEKKAVGQYPGMNTVQSLLRNKQPQ
jgi:hypothetical protein